MIHFRAAPLYNGQPRAPKPPTAQKETILKHHISVVIPFFQRKPGILVKAVRSALTQRGDFTVEIVIVDDASPVPARSELAALMAAHPGAIRIIEQANAGPAAARNKALDKVAPATTLVAFLDSDDEWIPSHLANAVAVMDSGLDFYFTDHYQLNANVSAFKRAGRITAAAHRKLDIGDDLYAYVGDMFDQILMGNVIGTSTVVYRYQKFPTLRFREAFVYAGEDYLFWLELSKLTTKIGFSTLVECTYGEGVNIFAGSGWGTEKSLIRTHYELKYKMALQRLFALTPAQSANIGTSIKTLRKSFVADVLHRLSHRKPIGAQLLRDHWRTDPQTFVQFVPLSVAVILKR
jgi:succinoglycan biosynthesis protein ExoW